MKKKLISLAGVLSLLATVGMAQATLVTIGTATYDPDGAGGAAPIGEFNLIWDDGITNHDHTTTHDSLVWLDYSNGENRWDNQMSWVAMLDSYLTINLFDDYSSITWDDDAWRLPSAGTNPQPEKFPTNSEMGHLYYEELGLDGTFTAPAELNATNFDNLTNNWYWTDTQYAGDPDDAWFYNVRYGYQYYGSKGGHYNGLAVRSGQVSVAPVPEPATMLLFGTGIAGLAGTRLRRKKK